MNIVHCQNLASTKSKNEPENDLPKTRLETKPEFKPRFKQSDDRVPRRVVDQSLIKIKFRSFGPKLLDTLQNEKDL